MARLQNPTLFFTTSPRTPHKMIPEIRLLIENLEGEKWNKKSQLRFAELLAKDKNFNGFGSTANMDFSARDRITRAPKALGFIDLKPDIRLTEAGKILLSGKRTEEVFLRQMLKFQIPSPFHRAPKTFEKDYCVKPYLEILRMIYELGTLSFDELMIFGLQLTHYRKFNEIISEIRQFRRLKAYADGSYKQFREEFMKNEVQKIFKDNIESGNTKTRQSQDKSVKKFVRTKIGTMHDYADACFRYLRATGLVEISQRGHSLSIMPEKKREVEFLLMTIDRNPVFIDNENDYKRYLYDIHVPVLFCDDRERLEKQIEDVCGKKYVLSDKTMEQLKNIFDEELQYKKKSIIDRQVKALKEYKEYTDVMDMFEDIKNNSLYDTPLMLEWNTWRAMTMLDGGDIKANLKLDDNGHPMSTAQGNMADIVCDYGDFWVSVEVTMQSGQRQYEMEGEPVARHLAKLKKETGKKAYCLFIAPKINDSCIAYFYALHTMNIAFYGGNSVIVPLELDVFMSMVEQSYASGYVPDPKQVEILFNYSFEQAKIASDEIEWYAKVKEKALNWLFQ